MTKYLNIHLYLEELSFNNVSFWTSGNSMPCPSSYAWCAVGEIIDAYNIPWKAPDSIDKRCVSLRAVNGTNGTALMAFDNDMCDRTKRAICEVIIIKIIFYN